MRFDKWVKVFVTFVAAATAAHADAVTSAAKPLALTEALDVASLIDFDLSPDGAWVAYTYQLNAENGTHIRLVELATGNVVELSQSAADMFMGGMPWSPDGRYFAYTSNEGGKPALRIWDRSANASRVVSVAVQCLGADTRWFPDSQRVLVPTKAPEDVAAALSEAAAPPSVHIYRAHLGNAEEFPDTTPASSADAQGCDQRVAGNGELSIVDLRTDAAERIVKRSRLALFHSPSPDGRYVAYTVFAGTDPATHDSLYDLRLLDLTSNRDERLVANVRSVGGKLFYWSPDSRKIAYFVLRSEYSGESNRRFLAPADLAVVTIGSRRVHALTTKITPALSARYRATWSPDSKQLYVLSIAGRLLEIQSRSGALRSFTSVTPKITRLIGPNESSAIWLHEHGKLWVAAEDAATASIELYELQLATDSARLLTRHSQDGGSRIDASTADGMVVFSASRPQRPRELLGWRERDAEAHPLAGLNAFLDDVVLADARTIRWRTAEGRELSGALLLPPGYRSGQRVPLVLWVYGGENGSRMVNRFGFVDAAVFNMQILATRGYAVLFPDAPQRMGQPLQDLLTDIVPGVEAAIAQGFADGERLAIMGNSYGAYSTLALITRTQAFKAAVISAVAHPDLLAQYLHMQPDGRSSEFYYESGQGLIGSTPWADPDRYRDNSPVYAFDKIATPVLIAQGELDPLSRVGADSVFVALRRLGKPVEYRLYQGEGHGIARPANVIDFWQRRLEFLAENLNIALDSEGRVMIVNGRAKSRELLTHNRLLEGGTSRAQPTSQPDFQVEMQLQ